MEDTEKSSSGFSSDSGGSCSGKSSFAVPSDEDAGKRRMPPSSPLGWPVAKFENPKWAEVSGSVDEPKLEVVDPGLKPNKTSSETEMMKERFSKLLLGEDMSGSGKGVCPALAISNAITNLCASVFGQLWRLEPLATEKKDMWRREMDWLLCVTDHIVELMPAWQTLPDGSKLEVMTCRPRSDLFINIPALHKLDNLLIELLDGFKETEFWYVDQGVVAPDTSGSVSFRKFTQRQEEKWWLPVPRIPITGLNEASRKQLTHKRECANQILKAAVAINSNTLAEMEVPESYLETLPKNGRTCLGDVIHRYITSDHFSAECLLDCLDLSAEHVALEMANRVEAAVFVWKRRNHSKPITCSNRSVSRSSWEMVKDFMADGDKRDLLAERAEGLLVSLKQRYPNLSQTTLDASKILNNKDIGKSILESYSRVLESLAFNIIARIDDVLYVDDLTSHSDKLPSSSTVSVTTRKRVSISLSMPCLGTPYKTASATPSFSPAPLVSPAGGERTPFLNSTNNINHLNKPPRRGSLGVKRVLSNYLSTETRDMNYSNQNEELPAPNVVKIDIEAPAGARTSTESRKTVLGTNLPR